MKIIKPRIIRIRDPQLREFRSFLRRLLKAAYRSERDRLHSQISLLRIGNSNLRMAEEDKIHKQIEKLDRARYSAPLGCCVCGRLDLDLLFNQFGKEWYCEGCYNFNQEYYKKNPHPYLPDWRKHYP